MPIASFNLSNLDGSNGLVITGLHGGDQLGAALGDAGDINNDGLSDLIIGAPAADVFPEGGSPLRSAGQVYVILGQRGRTDASVDVNALDGSNGFVIEGLAAGDQLGLAVGGAGDVNGDGLDDMILSAPGGDVPDGEGSNINGAGVVYLLFGRDGAAGEDFGASFDLTSLDGSNGFAITGENTLDLIGQDVTSLGDINGDGLDDIALGSNRADPENQGAAGEVYVILGSDGGFDASFDLASLDGNNGFVVQGSQAYDYLGFSVAGAGDVNGDGLQDLVIGAHRADPGDRQEAGSAYVIFGSTAGFDPTLTVSDLDGTRGLTLNGLAAGDYTGIAVSSAGDITGDGVDDLLIGASQADSYGQINAGATYVVFGNPGGFESTLNLAALDGSQGFVIRNTDALAQSGAAVSGAGDINGDGIDDLLVGAPNAPLGSTLGAGEVAVVLGRNVEETPFPSSLSTAQLLGGNLGFGITGLDVGDALGTSVSGLGNFNGDRFGDVVIGAPGQNGEAGALYVIYGADAFDLTTGSGTNDLTVVDLASGLGAESLAQFLVGNDVTVTNVRYTGSNEAAGLFVGGNLEGVDLGLDSGVVLGTGRVSDIPGTNGGDATGTGLETAGDSDLDGLLLDGTTTDGAVLEFDITPTQDTLSLEFIFASEEFDELVGDNLDDIFAIFVDGVPIALSVDPVLAPGPLTATTVTTLQNGLPEGAEDVLRNNQLPDAPLALELDGLTRVLTASVRVEAGQTIPVKVAIADGGDNGVDSAVFLGAGSLTSTPSVPGSIALRSDTAVTSINEPVLINVLGNDIPPEEGGVLTLVLPNAEPTINNGTIALDDGGTPNDVQDDQILYTPPVGFSGTDSFTYVVTDDLGRLASAQVTVRVNTPPDAVDFSIIINEGEVANLSPEDFLFFDDDGDAATSVIIKTLPDVGTLFLNQAAVTVGQVIPIDEVENLAYQPPDPEYFGTTGFTWNASDGVNTDPEDAFATIVVRPLPEEVTAVDDEFETLQDTPVILDLRANDINGSLLPIANDDEQTTSLGFLNTLPLPPLDNFFQGRTATLIETALGGVVLMPPAPDHGFAVYLPPPGFAGFDHFTYVLEIVEDTTYSNVAEVSIKVNNVFVGSEGETLARRTLQPPDSSLVLLLDDHPENQLEELPFVPIVDSTPEAPVFEQIAFEEPLVIISDVFAIEGSDAIFTVELSHEYFLPVTVNYQIEAGSAGLGRDFEVFPLEGSLTFGPGEIGPQIINVTVVADEGGDLEAQETFSVNLTSATNADLIPGGTTATGIIAAETDDALPQITVENLQVSEGTNRARFTVSLSDVAETAVTVDFATSPGSAEEGLDFIATSGSLTFEPGETTQTVEVFIVEDPRIESSEFFTVELSNAVGAGLADGTGIGVIVEERDRIDTDGNPVLATPVTALEGQRLEVDLRLTGDPGETITVPITLIDADANLVGIDEETDLLINSLDLQLQPEGNELRSRDALTSADVTITYPTDVLDLSEAGVRVGEAFVAAGFSLAAVNIEERFDSNEDGVVNDQDSLGRVRVSLFTDESAPVLPDGAATLVNLDFVAVEGTPPGEVLPIEVVEVRLNEGDRPSAALNGTVTVLGFQVVATALTSSSLTVTFSRPLEGAVLDSNDLELVGPEGPLQGSIFWDGVQTLTFLPSGETPLTAGDYTLTLQSVEDTVITLLDEAIALQLDYDNILEVAATSGAVGLLTIPRQDARGVVQAPGLALDGDADGLGGGNFVETLTLEAGDRHLSLPDIVAAAGQGIDANPLDSDINGFPVAIDNGEGLTSLDFTLRFNPTLFAVTSISLGADLPSDWTLEANFSLGDRAVIELAGTTPLPAGAVDLVDIQAQVPGTAPAQTSQLLSLTDIGVTGTTDSVLGDAAYQLVSQLGDVTGDGTYSSLDAALVSQFFLEQIPSFAAYPLVDPTLVADVSRDGVVDAFDAAIVAQQAVGLNPLGLG